MDETVGANGALKPSQHDVGYAATPPGSVVFLYTGNSLRSSVGSHALWGLEKD